MAILLAAAFVSGAAIGGTAVALVCSEEFRGYIRNAKDYLWPLVSDAVAKSIEFAQWLTRGIKAIMVDVYEAVQPQMLYNGFKKLISSIQSILKATFKKSMSVIVAVDFAGMTDSLREILVDLLQKEIRKNQLLKKLQEKLKDDTITEEEMKELSKLLEKKRKKNK